MSANIGASRNMNAYQNIHAAPITSPRSRENTVRPKKKSAYAKSIQVSESAPNSDPAFFLVFCVTAISLMERVDAESAASLRTTESERFNRPASIPVVIAPKYTHDMTTRLARLATKVCSPLDTPGEDCTMANRSEKLTSVNERLLRTNEAEKSAERSTRIEV